MSKLTNDWTVVRCTKNYSNVEKREGIGTDRIKGLFGSVVKMRTTHSNEAENSVRLHLHKLAFAFAL